MQVAYCVCMSLCLSGSILFPLALISLSVTFDSCHTVSHTVLAAAAKAPVTQLDVQTTILAHLVVFVILTMESLAFVNRVLVAPTAWSAVCQKQALKDALKLALKAAKALVRQAVKAPTLSPLPRRVAQTSVPRRLAPSTTRLCLP